jgi:hypothetical protein
MVPDRLWYRTDCVVRCCPFTCTGPASRPGQIFSSKWEAAGWGEGGGIAYDYILLEFSYDPPEGHPGQLVYTFVIRILSTHLNFNILCQLLL